MGEMSEMGSLIRERERDKCKRRRKEDKIPVSI